MASRAMFSQATLTSWNGVSRRLAEVLALLVRINQKNLAPSRASADATSIDNVVLPVPPFWLTCQSARERDPLSACKRDPAGGCVGRLSG